MAERYLGRGTKVLLPHGGLPENANSYLDGIIEETGGAFGPEGLQYRAQPELEAKNYVDGMQDTLMEDQNEVAPGVVFKYKDRHENGKVYPGRALWTVTRDCFAYCRFCTRGREIGIPGDMEGQGKGALAHTKQLSDEQIEESLKFIKETPGLNEVIVSGGDPLTLPPKKLTYILGELRKLQDTGKLKFVRIGTRGPVQKPEGIKEYHYQAISQLKIPRMMIHINYPAELRPESLHVLNRFRRDCNANVYSQTVLLRGVNDNVDTLVELFTKIAENGIIPYYLFQCDPNYWTDHFSVPIREAIQIVEKLRPRLSGIVDTANFVIDTPNGFGKLVVPKGGSFKTDFEAGYTDFLGNHFDLDNH